MLINCKEIVATWGIKPRGVLHIGAHEAEEGGEYARLNWGPIIWIEAQSKLANNLKYRLNPDDNKVIHAAVWDINGMEIELKITNNSQSTSLLELGTHNKDYPDVIVTEIEKVKTSRVDSLLGESDHFDFINLDIQGAELHALRGMGNLLNQVKYVYTEVNNRKVYIDCAQIEEIEEFLGQRGFEKACVRWVPQKGWGDALFIRKELLEKNLVIGTKSFLYMVRFYTQFYFHEIAHKVKISLNSKIGK